MERNKARFVALVLVPGTILGLFLQFSVGSTFSTDLATLWVTFILLWLLSIGVTLLAVITNKRPFTGFLGVIVILAAVIYWFGWAGMTWHGWMWFADSLLISLTLTGLMTFLYYSGINMI